MCVREMILGGNSREELGDSHKIFYSGGTNTRNGVGVMLDEKLRQKVTEVQRPTDRLIRVRLIIGGKT